MTLRNLFATAVAIAAAAVIPASSAATAQEPVVFGGGLEVVTDDVVVTVTVPTTPEPEYVSRVFEYDLYATCWTRRGKALPQHEQRIGGDRVPGSSGDYVLRMPDSDQTDFRFPTPVRALVDAFEPSGLASVRCPGGTTAGAYRLHLHSLEVYASSYGSIVDRTTAVDHYLPAPAGAAVSKVRRQR